MKSIACISSVLFLSGALTAQNATYSPYSRYGIGEPVPQVAAHNLGMGGAHIALLPDSTSPVFINSGNPAAYSLVRLTTLEIGGRFSYSEFRNSSAAIRKWNTNFSYGMVGMPVGRRGGLCFGLLPLSQVGYDSEGRQISGAGELTNRFSGSGGINRVFVGYGFFPFQKRWLRFRMKYAGADTTRRLGAGSFRLRNFGSRFLSDLSVGANAEYLFGSVQHNSRVIYPNSQLYNNTYLEQALTLNGFTGSFGLQGAFSIDSLGQGDTRRRLKQRVKLTFGVYTNVQNPIRGLYNDVAYNYIVTPTGAEVIRDTVIYNVDRRTSVTLPLSQGVGLGFKKGERLNVVADAAYTGWKAFTYPGHPPGSLADNYRVSIGVNYVPEKGAAGRGAFAKRVNYRLGASHETGYIVIDGRSLTNSFVSAGLGIPVGRGRGVNAMVNVSLQAGQFGGAGAEILSENYLRVHFGFTFCDRWFQKFRYD